MNNKFFEELGKGLDSLIDEGLDVVNELNAEIEKQVNEIDFDKEVKNMEDAFKKVEDEVSDFLDTLNEKIKESTEEKQSKYKLFRIRVKSKKGIEINYNKKLSVIEIGKKESEKKFNILIVEDISKKQINKIIDNVKYDKEGNFFTILIKKKHLRTV